MSAGSFHSPSVVGEKGVKVVFCGPVDLISILAVWLKRGSLTCAVAFEGRACTLSFIDIMTRLDLVLYIHYIRSSHVCVSFHWSGYNSRVAKSLVRYFNGLLRDPLLSSDPSQRSHLVLRTWVIVGDVAAYPAHLWEHATVSWKGKAKDRRHYLEEDCRVSTADQYMSYSLSVTRVFREAPVGMERVDKQTAVASPPAPH
jgi:hypothetical protein